jgi:hypothetical protein
MNNTSAEWLFIRSLPILQYISKLKALTLQIHPLKQGICLI